MIKRTHELTMLAQECAANATAIVENQPKYEKTMTAKDREEFVSAVKRACNSLTSTLSDTELLDLFNPQ